MKENINEISDILKDETLLESIIDRYDNLPYKESNELLDNLFYGNLDKIDSTNVNHLVAAGLYYNDYDLIECSISMSLFNKDNDLLFYIIDYMCEDYLNSKTDNITDIDKLKKHISRGHNSYPSDLYEAKYSLKRLYKIKNERKNWVYDKLFHKAALFASIRNNSEFFDRYKTSTIDEFRINIAGFTDKPIEFKNDTNRRIQKIVNLRTGFNERMFQKTPDERTIVNYLTYLLKNQKIACYDGLIAYKDKNGKYTDEYVCAKFEGENVKSDYIGYFDNDVFRNIKEKEVLAEAMIEYVKNGNISLIDIPDRLMESNDKSMLLKKGNN